MIRLDWESVYDKIIVPVIRMGKLYNLRNSSYIDDRKCIYLHNSNDYIIRYVIEDDDKNHNILYHTDASGHIYNYVNILKKRIICMCSNKRNVYILYEDGILEYINHQDNTHNICLEYLGSGASSLVMSVVDGGAIVSVGDRTYVNKSSQISSLENNLKPLELFGINHDFFREVRNKKGPIDEESYNHIQNCDSYNFLANYKYERTGKSMKIMFPLMDSFILTGNKFVARILNDIREYDSSN